MRLRILLLASNYSQRSQANGIASYTRTFATAMSARGHEVHVLAWSGDAQESGDVIVHARPQAGAERSTGSISVFPRSACYLLPWTTQRLVTARSVWKAIRRLDLGLDIVQAPDFGAPAYFLARSRRIPLVVRLHTPLVAEARTYGFSRPWDLRSADWLERSTVRRAQVLTAATNWLPEQLRQGGWLPDTEVRVVRNTTDFAKWAACGPVEATSPVILLLGRLEPRKGQDLLLRAAAELAPQVDGLELIMVGNASNDASGAKYRDGLIAMARQAGIRWRILDAVAENDLPGLYSRARVVAVPSLQEGFSNVGLEAMAAARPIVCTSETGIAEIVRGTGAGAVVPTGDPHQLALALLPYLRSTTAAA